ncbi:MAG TPA: hypothetical protein VGM20_07750 [Gemmatimonadales bacterium]|jgi:hypothetical protein
MPTLRSSSTDRSALATLIFLGCLLACSSDYIQTNTTGPDNDPTPPPPDGVAAFSVAPMNTTGTLTPLGSLAPPGHVLPTNHVYFYAVDFDHPPAIPDSTIRPVYAPTTGTVSYIIHAPTDPDYKIVFRVTNTFYYMLGHVVLTQPLKVGDILHAGDQVGTSDPGATVDLGAYDKSVTLTGFANPARYGDETLHCVSPWAYFTEPLRSQFYARLRRVPSAPDKDGHIDLDRIGTLAGAWYDQSLPIDSTESPTGWLRTVAFVTDYNDPSLVRVSIGGTIAVPGLWTIPPGTPRPENVTPSSGLVAYPLTYTESTNVQWGLMLLQMTDATHLRIEVLPGSQASSGAFDAGVHSYVR